MADIRHMQLRKCPFDILNYGKTDVTKKVSAPVLQFAVMRHSFYIGMANQGQVSPS
jgi:hypothetical protein